MEWNRTVDHAIVSGVPETEILELKKSEITDRVKEPPKEVENYIHAKDESASQPEWKERE